MKDVENLVNEVHAEEVPKLLKEFEAWFDKACDKNIGVIMPELVIAEYCVDKTNKRKRVDIAKIIFVDKV